MDENYLNFYELGGEAWLVTAAVVAILVAMSTFCHPTFFVSKSTNPSNRNTNEIIYVLQIWSIIGNPFLIQSSHWNTNTTKHPREDIRGTCFRP